jgi:hypothetical protein
MRKIPGQQSLHHTVQVVQSATITDSNVVDLVHLVCGHSEDGRSNEDASLPTLVERKGKRQAQVLDAIGDQHCSRIHVYQF